jgi:hypothetical protein
MKNSKDRKCNGQKNRIDRHTIVKKITTQKTEDWHDSARWTPIKTWGELGWFWRVSNSCSTSGTHTATR